MLTFVFFVIVTLTHINYAMLQPNLHTPRRDKAIVDSYREVVQNLLELELGDLVKTTTDIDDITANLKLTNSVVAEQCAKNQESIPHSATKEKQRKSNTFFLVQFYENNKNNNENFVQDEETISNIKKIISNEKNQIAITHKDVYKFLSILCDNLLRVTGCSPTQKSTIDILNDEHITDNELENNPNKTMAYQASLFYLNVTNASLLIKTALTNQRINVITVDNPRGTAINIQMIQNATVVGIANNHNDSSKTKQLWHLIKNNPYRSISLAAAIGMLGWFGMKYLLLIRSKKS